MVINRKVKLCQLKQMENQIEQAKSPGWRLKKKSLCLLLLLPLLLSAFISTPASATSINSAQVTMSFIYQDYDPLHPADGWHQYHNLDQGTVTLPWTIVSRNNSRTWTFITGLGVTVSPNQGEQHNQC